MENQETQVKQPDTTETYTGFGPITHFPINQGACPNCGYCPHCGRGGFHTYPWWPQQPWITYTAGTQL